MINGVEKKEFERFVQEKGKETIKRIKKEEEKLRKINRPLKLVLCGVEQQININEKLPPSADAVTNLE